MSPSYITPGCLPLISKVMYIHKKSTRQLVLKHRFRDLASDSIGWDAVQKATFHKPPCGSDERGRLTTLREMEPQGDGVSCAHRPLS